MKTTTTTITAATAPVVELKKVKSFRGMEGYGLNAEVWMNGKKVAYMIDEGNGGSYHYDIFDREKFDALTAYVKTLPDVVTDYPSFLDAPAEKMTFPMDMDLFLDGIFEKLQEEKEMKKMQKKMVDHIMWGIPGDPTYRQIKAQIPLAQLPKEKLQEVIDERKKKFAAGEKFLNTNFEQLGIRI